MLQYATYYTLICGLSQYDLRPFTFQTTLSCPIAHRLVNSVTASEASVRHTPTATTPVQDASPCRQGMCRENLRQSMLS